MTYPINKTSKIPEEPAPPASTCSAFSNILHVYAGGSLSLVFVVNVGGTLHNPAYPVVECSILESKLSLLCLQRNSLLFRWRHKNMIILKHMMHCYRFNHQAVYKAVKISYTSSNYNITIIFTRECINNTDPVMENRDRGILLSIYCYIIFLFFLYLLVKFSMQDLTPVMCTHLSSCLWTRHT